MVEEIWSGYNYVRQKVEGVKWPSNLQMVYMVQPQGMHVDTRNLLQMVSKKI